MALLIVDSNSSVNKSSDCNMMFIIIYLFGFKYNLYFQNNVACSGRIYSLILRNTTIMMAFTEIFLVI